MISVQKIIVVSIALVLCFLTLTPSYAQNVFDDIPEDSSPGLNQDINAPRLVSETIKTIAPSKKIFILTNDNNTFSKGDFISLLVANKLVCRALVAKTTDQNLSGIKIVKIYDLALWKELSVGKEVLVLKGDDSYYTNKPKNESEDQAEELKLKNEEDLFNSTTIEDEDNELEESSSRLIKTDNLISAGLGIIEGKDVDQASKNYSHVYGSWGYQIADNIWAEGALGTNTIRDFPSTGQDTRLTSITTRLKYTFNAPFYSYLMPYVGYQIIQVDAPGAGVDDGSKTAQELEDELLIVDSIKKSSLVFGLTVIKRVVPGWFLRADLGNDIISGGLTLEF